MLITQSCEVMLIYGINISLRHNVFDSLMLQIPTSLKHIFEYVVVYYTHTHTMYVIMEDLVTGGLAPVGVVEERIESKRAALIDSCQECVCAGKMVNACINIQSM